MRTFLGGLLFALLASQLVACSDETRSVDTRLDPITVLEEGSGDLEQLRLNLTEGQIERFRLRVNTSVDAGPRRVLVPALIFEGRREVTEVDGDEFEITTTYTNAYIDPTAYAEPAQEQRVAGYLAPVKGLELTQRVTDRGLQLSLESTAGMAISPAVRRVLAPLLFPDSMATPLPDAPVGVGARWTYSAPVPSSLIRATRTTEYTLERRQGDKLFINVDVDQVVSKQSFPNGVQVTGGSGSGSDVVVSTLNSLTPTDSDLFLMLTTRYQLGRSKGSFTTETRTELFSSIKP